MSSDLRLSCDRGVSGARTSILSKCGQFGLTEIDGGITPIRSGTGGFRLRILKPGGPLTDTYDMACVDPVMMIRCEP